MSNDNNDKSTVHSFKITSVRKLTSMINEATRNGEKELVKATVLENTETTKKSNQYLDMKYRRYVRKVLQSSG